MHDVERLHLEVAALTNELRRERAAVLGLTDRLAAAGEQLAEVALELERFDWPALDRSGLLPALRAALADGRRAEVDRDAARAALADAVEAGELLADDGELDEVEKALSEAGHPTSAERSPADAVREMAAAVDAARCDERDRCVAIARGCTDYLGGYASEPELLAAYHHGMDTVARSLAAPDDMQRRVVEAIGRDAAQGLAGVMADILRGATADDWRYRAWDASHCVPLDGPLHDAWREALRDWEASGFDAAVFRATFLRAVGAEP